MNWTLSREQKPSSVLKINSSTLELIQGNITEQRLEAMANAANSSLAGGAGVDGAIHKAAGPSVMKELKEKYRGCPTGSAVITEAGQLNARFIIHAVGPRYSGRSKDAELLAGSYRKSLELALSYKIETIAFPSISTGVYGYPLEEAAPIALDTVIRFLKEHSQIKLVRFVLFDSKTFDAYAKALKEIKI